MVMIQSTERVEQQDFWRYSRQVALSAIGLEGQRRLKRSSVAVVGLGGLGSQVAVSLAAMGVGRLKLVDFDVVSLPDLHRQTLYSESDLGRAKVEAAKEALEKRNGSIKVDAVCELVEPDNAVDVVSDADVVVDALDSFSARYSLSRACKAQRKPVVFGSAIEEYGNVCVFRPWQGLCLECVYPGLRDADFPTCAVAGVFPQLVQVVGAIQSLEAVRLITGDPTLLNTLLFIDLRTMSLDKIKLSENPSCASENQQLQPVGFEPVEMCMRSENRLMMLKLRTRLKIDRVFEDSKRIFGDAHRVGEMAVRFRVAGSTFEYTAAGVLLGELNKKESAFLETAKLTMHKVAEALSKPR
jgi:molybdopterin/thiamine biosynthesis adenylyltransferase